jgi:hypothetical protein
MAKLRKKSQTAKGFPFFLFPATGFKVVPEFCRRLLRESQGSVAKSERLLGLWPKSPYLCIRIKNYSCIDLIVWF